MESRELGISGRQWRGWSVAVTEKFHSLRGRRIQIKEFSRLHLPFGLLFPFLHELLNSELQQEEEVAAGNSPESHYGSSTSCNAFKLRQEFILHDA